MIASRNFLHASWDDQCAKASVHAQVWWEPWEVPADVAVLAARFLLDI